MTLSSRLDSKTTVLDNGCWMFTGGCGSRGYGNIWDNGKTRSAHIVAYEIHKGPVTDGLSVLHTCDNRWCVNPDHLFLGTQQDNINDMIHKGRDGFSGERNGRALLNKDSVLLIKHLLDTGEHSQQTIANAYKVSRSTIAAIKSGRNWGWR